MGFAFAWADGLLDVAASPEPDASTVAPTALRGRAVRAARYSHGSVGVREECARVKIAEDANARAIV